MPNDDAGKNIMFWDTIVAMDPDRINKCKFGYLISKARLLV
jgi:hypothetical protein